MTWPLFRVRAWLVVIAIGTVSGQFAHGKSPSRLVAYTSDHYTIHTDMLRQEAEPFGRHMDAVFEQFAERFTSFRSDQPERMALYLFKTQRDYIDFLRQFRIDGTNSGGIFVVQPKLLAVATWVQGKSRSETFRTLQHEGFHQFAHRYIGPTLPIWINEGLAVYFESGILVGKTFRLGLADVRRVLAIQNAIEHNRVIRFDRLLNMTADQWQQGLLGDVERAQFLYDQSWSIVHFLIHAEDGKYRRAFETMLHLIADGQRVHRAFTTAFNSSDTRLFAAKWKQFARQVEPDSTSTVISRMEFLARGLLYLHDQSDRPPKNIHQLRSLLQKIRFRATQSAHGVKIPFDSEDESMYQFLRRGRSERFQLLEPAGAQFPPRITAPGLRPEPTLVWSRDGDGTLTHDVVFR